MSYLKIKGIVIREVNTGEADKIITILSKSHGKITGFARGARRTKSRLIAGTQFLCFSDFVLFKGRDMYTVTSCEVIEPFYEIRNNVEKLTYAAHLVELAGDVIQENQPSTKVLQLFLNTLHLLSKTEKSPQLLARIFELRILAVLGFSPHVRSCVECGKDELDGVFFSFRECGFICGCCSESDGSSVKISTGAAKAIYHIITAPVQDLFNFELSQDVLNELSRVSRRYLKDRLEKDYNKLDFLKSLSI